MAWSLDSIVSPLSLECFFSTYWDHSFLHVEAAPGKFADLFSWQLLNEVLNHHRFHNSRLKLVRNGAQFPSRSYLSSYAQQIEQHLLVQQLQAGYTLVLDGADEVSMSLRELVVEIEKTIHTPVHANLYASWKKEEGFGIHFDDTDTLILQVAGRKQWRVWNPTRQYPLRPDIEEVPWPTEAPIWNAELVDGSMLYIPRGWWHAPKPVDEPSLHITITMPNSSGVDLIHWMANEFRKYTVARQNVPLLSSDQIQIEFIEQMLGCIREFWSEDVLERYRLYCHSERRSRPTIQLPQLK